jgi:hypothetical protein
VAFVFANGGKDLEHVELGSFQEVIDMDCAARVHDDLGQSRGYASVSAHRLTL